MTDNTTAQQQALIALAERCDLGAAQLRADAADPGATLAEHGYTDLPADRVADFGHRHAAAANTAASYAAQLREQVASGQPVTDAQIQQAEKVADAAELDGMLLDGRPVAEATATADNAHVWHPADKAAWEDGTHPAQTKAAAVEESGQFTHVAETINGVDQVPFWQLGHVDQQHDTDTDEA